jgi:hypothetical protein
MEVRVATVLVPEMLQLPPRAQEQAPALSSEPQAAAAAAASPLLPAGPRALLLLLLLGGGQRPRGRPLPRGHPLHGLLHRQVLGVAPQVAREDVGRHGGGEGRGGVAAPEEPDLGSGARVDLVLAQGKERRRGENEIVSSSIFFIFCASAPPPHPQKQNIKTEKFLTIGPTTRHSAQKIVGAFRNQNASSLSG